MLVLVIGSCIYAVLICLKKGLRAGVFALENYYLFSDLLSKPWGKLATYPIGVAFAFFYLEVLAYRKLDKEQKIEKYPRMHYMHEKRWVGIVCHILG